MKNILVLIPTYNESESIILLLQRIDKIRRENIDILQIDILVIDDNSPDKTGQLAQSLNLSGLTVLSLNSKNGIGPAYIAGFKWGLTKDYGALIQMDADGSHRPIDLVTLIAEFEKNPSIDCLIGSRWTKGGSVVNWPKHREMLSRTANTYAKIVLGINVNDMTAGFRIYRRNLLEKINFENVISDGYCFQIELLIKIVKLHLYVLRL